MGLYSRNDRSAFAALAAEEERRRADEQAANRRPPADEDPGGALTRGERGPSRIGRIVGRIRRAIGR